MILNFFPKVIKTIFMSQSQIEICNILRCGTKTTCIKVLNEYVFCGGESSLTIINRYEPSEVYQIFVEGKVNGIDAIAFPDKIYDIALAISNGYILIYRFNLRNEEPISLFHKFRKFHISALNVCICGNNIILAAGDFFKIVTFSYIINEQLSEEILPNEQPSQCVKREIPNQNIFEKEFEDSITSLSYDQENIIVSTFYGQVFISKIDGSYQTEENLDTSQKTILSLTNNLNSYPYYSISYNSTIVNTGNNEFTIKLDDLKGPLDSIYISNDGHAYVGSKDDIYIIEKKSDHVISHDDVDQNSQQKSQPKERSALRKPTLPFSKLNFQINPFSI